MLKGAGLDLHDFWTLRWAAQKDDIMAAVAAMMAEKDADRLVAMALKDAAFFTNDAVFADIAVHGQRRTCGIDSSEFRDWLQHEHYKKTKTTVSDGAVRQAIRALTARAKYEDGIPHHTVYIRFAEHGGRLYIDLCDPQWQVVEARDDAWEVLPGAPDGIRFQRTSNMRSLPTPTRGGKLDDMRPFINLDDAGAYQLWASQRVGLVSVAKAGINAQAARLSGPTHTAASPMMIRRCSARSLG